jgi:hypothetical protein
MSEESVRILRAFYEEFNRGGNIEDVLHYVDPAVDVHPGVIAPDSKAEYHGRQALRDFFDAIVIGPWETVTIEPKEMIETDDGRVLSVDLWRFRGRGGIEIDRELPNLFTLRHGLITRIDGFTDRVQALEAPGLSD